MNKSGFRLFLKPLARRVLWAGFSLLFLTPLFGGELRVSSLDLQTRGGWTGNGLTLKTRGDFSLELEGGYKVFALLRFKLNSDALELTDTSSQAPGVWNLLKFQYVELGVREIFNSSFNLGYFVGEGAFLGTGAGFFEELGTPDFSSRFPAQASPRRDYSGISQIRGTGFILSGPGGGESSRLVFATAQDLGAGGQGKFTSYLRGFWDLDRLRFEVFASASYPRSTMGIYSGGILFYYRPSPAGEILTMIGVPRYDPAQPFDLSQLYFLIEPRLKLGNLFFTPTLFLRPGYYYDRITGEGTPNTDEGEILDINLDLHLGIPETQPFTAGLAATISLDPKAGDPGRGDEFFRLGITPYCALQTAGLLWDFKLRFGLLKSSAEPFAELAVGVKARF